MLYNYITMHSAKNIKSNTHIYISVQQLRASSFSDLKHSLSHTIIFANCILNCIQHFWNLPMKLAAVCCYSPTRLSSVVIVFLSYKLMSFPTWLFLFSDVQDWIYRLWSWYLTTHFLIFPRIIFTGWAVQLELGAVVWQYLWLHLMISGFCTLLRTPSTQSWKNLW
jgi:hypothetical protein